MASTFTPNKLLEEPANGDYVNTWSTPVNANFTAIDTALGGKATISVGGASGTNTLTSGQYQPLYIILSGALSANVTYQFPSGVGGQWIIYNGTTGAFTITFNSAGGGSSLAIAQGSRALVLCDATNVVLSSNAGIVPVGSLMPYAGASAPSLWLLCYGQAISRTTYAALFTALGTAWGAGDGSTTFNVPDLRGRVPAGVDNMGGSTAGRITNAVSGVTGTTLGATGGDQRAQQDTLTATSTSVVTDPGHAHTAPGLYQGAGGTNGPSSFGNIWATSTGTTNPTTTGITVATSTSVTSTLTGASQNVQPVAMTNYIIYAGV